MEKNISQFHRNEVLDSYKHCAACADVNNVRFLLIVKLLTNHFFFKSVRRRSYEKNAHVISHMRYDKTALNKTAKCEIR